MFKRNEKNKLTIQQLTKSSFVSADIVVNFSNNTIVRAGKTYTLQPKVLELLILLCSANGETLSKDKLCSSLWPNTVVGPDSLANTMAKLRKALADDAKQPNYIQTVQRKGYRWLQPVTLIANKRNATSKKAVLLAALASSSLLATAAFFKQKEEHKFPFPDLSIKKLADGGYEIQAGIEGKLTEEKKAALLKELKRITGEEHSGMEFTIDTDIPKCLAKDGSFAACETNSH
ncbi:transcriptional regulator [Thalassotalea aquiviva]|uniref:winged helix-turn-helix domain-containing protein n=1 Tax=Thalassotalea aquiviva TaxID=3242415 RepID=UPI00352B30EF